LAPVALPLLAATPLAVWGARPAVVQALRRAGLLLIPEETQTATELRRAWGGSRPVAQPVALSRLQAA
ncbi:MAG: glucans biosynthesis glucosyltransferase MdoH, partial [Rhodoferax sp.]|nr:glucans biosynthesis glucosyltransferase MdoH [Rhodoferax sp.]